MPTHTHTMTNEELRDLVAGLSVAQAKNEKEIANLLKSIKGVHQEMGGISNSQGLVAEEFFYNSLLDKPQIGHLKFDQINMNMQGGKKNDRFECDIAAINGNSLALIEVKYNVPEEAVEQVEDHIRRFRKFFPFYDKHKIYGGVAGFHIPKSVTAAAHKKGFFVLKRKGGIFTSDVKDMRAF